MVVHEILVLGVGVRIPVVQQNSMSMRNNSGYKGMLRDRCPEVVNYALKWQKAKERWIDHAYVSFIKFYVDNKEKYHTTRIILGIAKFYRNFEFDKSIDWENLTTEETLYWKRVSSWVRWFMQNYAYIENMYSISKQAGKSDMEIKVDIICGYLSDLLPDETATKEEKQAKFDYIDKLVNFLVDCFEKRI